MFEKEAEDIANKRCREIMCFGHCSFSSPKHHRCGEWHREYNCAKEGIEYGYNKAKKELAERLDEAKEMLEQFIKFSMFPLTTKKDIEDVQILLKSASQFCKEME